MGERPPLNLVPVPKATWGSIASISKDMW
jgi:hypothetical protein